jgi:hypothetical protein
LAKEVSLDLWVIHHFRILPTDERYKRLTDNQKVLLFYGWVDLPSTDEIRMSQSRRAGDPVIGEEDTKIFKNLGYTPAQIRKMKEQLENAGYSQSE